MAIAVVIDILLKEGYILNVGVHLTHRMAQISWNSVMRLGEK